MQTIAETSMMDGTHRVFRHDSTATQCSMDWALFTPEQGQPDSVLIFLSGLTCTWENAATKAGAQAVAARHNMAIVFPDTSPRGADVANSNDYWLGQGAGFYLTATQAPWAPHFAMDRYITEELPMLINTALDMDISANGMGITGHSMGGHGALTLAMKHPHLFRSVSAFSPISSAMESGWGQNVLPAYLGDDKAAHQAHDATALMASHGWGGDMLVDQGLADDFLDEHLKPHLLAKAAENAGIPLTLRQHAGYDHSYYFVASFMADHVAWHASRLTAS